MELLEQLEHYTPWNSQEEADRLELLRWLRSGENIHTRDNSVAHLTASAWVVSPDRSLVLMAHHKLYNTWAWLGGHADGDSDLLRVAIREAREESGITSLRPVLETPISLEILPVQGHIKRGRYVSSHLHLNVTWLLEADTHQALRCKPDENSAVAWLPVDRLDAYSDEAWFLTHVYEKLREKCDKLFPGTQRRFL